MNLHETIRLCELIRAISPTQQFTDETPAVWAPLLADVRQTDAIDAVKRLAQRQRFFAAADIITEVKRVRRDRLERTPIPEPPSELADDPAAYVTWARRITAAIADGAYTPPAIEARRRSATRPGFRAPDTP